MICWRLLKKEATAMLVTLLVKMTRAGDVYEPGSSKKLEENDESDGDKEDVTLSHSITTQP